LNLWYFGALTVAAILVMTGKALIVALAVWLFRRSFRTAIASGLLVCQIGEFTFVVAQQAFGAGLLPNDTFQFTLGVSLLSLISTPYVIAIAPRTATWIARRMPARSRAALSSGEAPPDWRRVIVIGYGPAGQRVVSELTLRQIPYLVLDTNPTTIVEHRATGAIELGDATQREVLQHVGVGQSLAVVVTIPDPATSRLVTAAAQRLAPGVPIIVRSRYHQYSPSLREAGADCVVDEEEVVGRDLAVEAVRAAESKSVHAVTHISNTAQGPQ
jgi:CPA2 family monovalent cation:H+ antiporter-2